MKKSVAIITLFNGNYNYGGVLQAYALQKYVSNMEYDCSIVNFHTNNKLSKIKVLKFSTLISRFYHKFQMKIYMHFNKNFYNKMADKYKLFNEFMNNIPQTELVNDDNYKEKLKQFDIYIVGSDQVWSPESISISKIYLLDGLYGRKISYAASSWNGTYSNRQKQILSDYLKQFDSISVREEKLYESISEIVKIKVEHVLDPTFLIDKEEWIKIAKDPDIKEKYAFVYLIHMCDETKKYIFEFCRKNGLKMIIIPHAQGWYKKTDEIYYDEQKCDVGPYEWLGLIKNADFIFTDSFHGTIFSVIFNKKFITFENITNDEKNNNGLRKYSLLKSIQLLDRCKKYDFYNFDLIYNDKINYLEVNKKIDELKEKSIRFLKNSLDIGDE